MARGLNKVMLIGNLGADPEVRYTQSNTAVTNFSVATTETWKDKATGEMREITEWHRCVAYRRTAEIAGEFLRKGSKVFVEGKNQTRSYTPNDGIERFTTEIVVNDLQLLDRPSHDDGDERRRQHDRQSMAQTRSGLGSPMPGPAPQRQPAVQPAPQQQAFNPDDDLDDDIPF